MRFWKKQQKLYSMDWTCVNNMHIKSLTFASDYQAALESFRIIFRNIREKIFLLQRSYYIHKNCGYESKITDM